MMNREPGNFYYDPEHELFLVITDSGDDDGMYTMAVHGWWELSDERISEYIDNKERGLLSAEDLRAVIESDGSPELSETFEELSSLFELYEDGLDEDAPHTEFKYDEDE